MLEALSVTAWVWTLMPQERAQTWPLSYCSPGVLFLKLYYTLQGIHNSWQCCDDIYYPLNIQVQCQGERLRSEQIWNASFMGRGVEFVENSVHFFQKDNVTNPSRGRRQGMCAVWANSLTQKILVRVCKQVGNRRIDFVTCEEGIKETRKFYEAGILGYCVFLKKWQRCFDEYQCFNKTSLLSWVFIVLSVINPAQTLNFFLRFTPLSVYPFIHSSIHPTIHWFSLPTRYQSSCLSTVVIGK